MSRPTTAEDRPAAAPSGPGASSFASRPFERLVETLAARRSREVIDLGGHASSTLALFGERLGCRVHILDLVAEVGRLRTSGGRIDRAAVARWFPEPDARVDAVLCWDVFDWIDLSAASLAASEITRVMAPGGHAYALFRTAPSATAEYAKFHATIDGRLARRIAGVAPSPASVLENREIVRLFDGLRVIDSNLVEGHMREILFLRPDYLAAAGPVR